jgi:hypothetical protein
MQWVIQSSLNLDTRLVPEQVTLDHDGGLASGVALAQGERGNQPAPVVSIVALSLGAGGTLIR